MADSEDGDTAAPPQQVTAARDAYVAGRDMHLHMPSAARSRDEEGPGVSFAGAAGVQLGSGNVQVNNYYGRPPRATEAPQPVCLSGLDGSAETTASLDQAERDEVEARNAAATSIGPRLSSFPAQLTQRTVPLSNGLHPGTLLAIEVQAHHELEQATVVVTGIAGPPGAATIPPPARLYWHPSREISATVAQGASSLINVSRVGPLPPGAIMDTPDQDLPWTLPFGQWQVKLQLTARGYPALHLTALFHVSPADGFPVQRIEWLALTII
jgi:hypothetical protein